MRALIPAILFACLAAFPAAAEPIRYALEREKSVVGFAWDFGADEVRGRMPVAAADIVIDFDRLNASRVAVALDVTGAEAGFPFASQAMKGPKVLYASRFPNIVFRSRQVTPDASGALVTGDMTIRGVTRPATLRAELYRQRGTRPGDLDAISILVTGSVSRKAYGATGWSDLAGDEVRLAILVRLRRAG